MRCMNTSSASDVQRDAELIAQLGGPAQVAEMLGYDKTAGGVQRVHNWLSRGIPPRVKLAFPRVFLAARINAATADAVKGR
jgi:hypothetical protein